MLTLTLTLTQFISDNSNKITQMWVKKNYTFTITNEIKIITFAIKNDRNCNAKSNVLLKYYKLNWYQMEFLVHC